LLRGDEILEFHAVGYGKRPASPRGEELMTRNTLAVVPSGE
jgi:hypothetical protein